MLKDAVDRQPTVIEGVLRLKGVFLEIPGTRLTPAGAAKLAGLDQAVCELLLAALEDARFLSRAADGTYQRRTRDSPYA